MLLPLESNKTYLISYQFNGKFNLFDTDDNYLQFLKLYNQFIQPCVETYAYCLTPLQIHFLLKVKSEKEIFTFLKASERIPESQLTFDEYSNLSLEFPGISGNVFSLQMSKLFSGMINTYLDTFSSKKMKPAYTLNRTEIADETDFVKIVFEIHSLPYSQSVSDKPELWRYSSCAAYLSDKTTLLNRERTISFFKNKQEFFEAQNLFFGEVVKSQKAFQLHNTI